MAGKWQPQTAVEGLMRRTRASESVGTRPHLERNHPGMHHRPADGTAGRARGSHCAAGVHSRPPHHRD
eukprot:6826438-Pyramimonas_sp.AAC.1